MLVDLLHHSVFNTEDREVLGLDELVKQTSAAA
jgi:hypothetical protein